MAVVGVAHVASELGVSPRRVRQMLADGVLSGQRVGRAWLIESEELRKIQHRRPDVGRPWSAGSAWAVLAMADGEEPDLSPVDRSRAKKRLAQGLGSIVKRLDARADERCFYAHPGVLHRLSEAGEIVCGGPSAAVEHGADLVVGDGFEGYVRAQDLEQVVRRFGLDEQSDRPNVVLRVVDDAVWPFEPGQSFAGRSVVALDLLGSTESRSRRAGAELLERR